MDTNKIKEINRREALKRMGMFATGAAISSLGLSAFTSCVGNSQKKRIILYFTATGNSLYIAQQLVSSKEQLLSIPQMIKEGRYEFEADEIGIIYPIYGHMPPNIVRSFIERAMLKAEYKFAILTYGARKCNSIEIWDEVSSHANNVFDYIATIVMVDNWLPNFDMNEQMKIEKNIPENMQRITDDLDQRKHWHEPVSEEERQMHAGFMAYTALDPNIGFLKKSENYYTITDACVDCGACIDVCPRGNYKFTSNGIAVNGDCDFCFACIQNCPQKAIQFKKIEDDPLLRFGEKNPNARYRNPHVSLMDIKRANKQ